MVDTRLIKNLINKPDVNLLEKYKDGLTIHVIKHFGCGGRYTIYKSKKESFLKLVK